MRSLQYILGLATALFIVIVGSLVTIPVIFHDRVLPGVHIAAADFSGIPDTTVAGTLEQLDRQLATQKITIEVRNTKATRTLGELGIHLATKATAEQVKQVSWRALLQPITLSMVPTVAIDEAMLSQQISADFNTVIKPPKNASLTIKAANHIVVTPAATGEGPNIQTLANTLGQRVATRNWQQPVSLELQTVAASVQDTEVQAAKALAEQLLRSGMQLSYQDQQWTMKPFTVSRLIQFQPIPDPQDARNQILGITLDNQGLQDYLLKTISPDVDRPAQNARFERADDGLVTQFAVPQTGLQVDVAATAQAINDQLHQFHNQTDLAVTVMDPAVKNVDNIKELGITTLLASGYSDFKGSPVNRVHNIEVGTSRFQGVLIPPNEEFSFDKYLGPVDGEHGFKPELVIKSNVTTPEFGGGLCQVSTTAFRAAVYSGLKITKRRNHAYAVKYYGTPGFDSTIYPPYTDLRFINNTPGYILIQTKIEGTRLTFDFWGTPDDREVTVDGPHTYDHQPNGAVKATLAQKVTKGDTVLIDDTFYSRYKSPDLFPHVTHTDPPTASAPTT